MEYPTPPYTGLTAGAIVDYLKQFPPETDIHVEELIFVRWKQRGENLLAMEFSPANPNATGLYY